MKRKSLAAFVVGLGLIFAPLSGLAANAAEGDDAFPRCEGSEMLPLSTNLNDRGWYVENGEYVEGGLKIGSATEDSYAYVELSPAVTLSELETVSFDADPNYGAILFYNDDYSVNVHYEPYYSDPPNTGDPLWTNSPNILPANAGGQGGPYSGNFSDLLTNPEVTNLAFWVNAGHEVTLRSLTFNCKTQPFSYMAEAPEPEPVVETRENVETDCAAGTVMTTTQSRETGEATYDPESNTWTLGEFGEWENVGDPVVTEAGEDVCPTPQPEPEPKPEPKSEAQLAATGSESNIFFPLLAALASATGAGALFLGRRRRA